MMFSTQGSVVRQTGCVPWSALQAHNEHGRLCLKVLEIGTCAVLLLEKHTAACRCGRLGAAPQKFLPKQQSETMQVTRGHVYCAKVGAVLQSQQQLSQEESVESTQGLTGGGCCALRHGAYLLL